MKEKKTTLKIEIKIRKNESLMISMENWVTEEMKECDIKKNTIRANRADLETTNGYIMSVENTVKSLNYAAYGTGMVSKIWLNKDRFIPLIDYYIRFKDRGSQIRWEVITERRINKL